MKDPRKQESRESQKTFNIFFLCNKEVWYMSLNDVNKTEINKDFSTHAHLSYFRANVKVISEKTAFHRSI